MQENTPTGPITHRPEGDFTVVHIKRLKDEFSKDLSESEALVFDLSHVSSIDTAGLQLLAVLKREAEGLGKEFKITSFSQAAVSAIKLYNLEEFFGVHDAALVIHDGDDLDDNQDQG